MLNTVDAIVQNGSVWTGIDKQFKVTKVSYVNGKTWVFYKQCKNHKEEFGKEYSCYQEAFAGRFKEFKNY